MNTKAEPARAPVRAQTPASALKRGEYLGRGGKILRRDRAEGHNPFDFPDSVKESGWSYQWCRADIVGSSEFSEIALMRRVGWDYVKPEQLEGYFAHECKDMDHVEIAGMILMERPEQMTRDAQEEQLKKAHGQYVDHINGRCDAEAPLPPGILPTLREIELGRRESADPSLKPTYSRVMEPAGDHE